MKSGRAFWGTLFLSIGVLGLLGNFFSLSIDWGTAWKFWPLLLVLLGVALFMKNSRSKWMIVAAIGLTAGVVIYTSIQKGVDTVDSLAEGEFGDWGDGGDNVSVVKQEFAADADSATEIAEFRFESGAGDFSIAGETARLFEAGVESSIGGYEMTQELQSGIAKVYLGFADRDVHWKGDKHANRVRMKLSPLPLWRVRFETGAAKAELDLRPYRVEKLDIDAGAASIVVRIGDRADTTRVNIDTGASSLRITVPRSSACEVRTESALSSKHLNGFEEVRDGHYRASGSPGSNKLVILDVEAGLSSITVDREP